MRNKELTDPENHAPAGEASLRRPSRHIGRSRAERGGTRATEGLSNRIEG